MPVYKEEAPSASKYRLLQSEYSESGEEEAVSSDALGIEDIYILIGINFNKFAKIRSKVVVMSGYV